MLARTHAVSGLCAGLALAPHLGLTTVAEAAVFASVTAGYALLPDLDHEGATATRSMGPVTDVVGEVLQGVSVAAYRATRTKRDRKAEGTHRHLTHTLAFAAALGAGVGVAAGAGGVWVVLPVLAIGLWFVRRSLGWLAALLGAGALGWVLLAASTGPVVALGATSAWVGLAVGLGCAAHSVGDALTLAGCPLLWPLPLGGQRWRRLGPPRWLRFRTGGWFERWVALPVFAVGAGLLVPGAWSVLVGAVSWT